MINIAGFDANGKPFAVWSCTLLQDDDQPSVNAEGKEHGRYCSWMDYQKARRQRPKRRKQNWPRRKSSAIHCHMGGSSRPL